MSFNAVDLFLSHSVSNDVLYFFIFSSFASILLSFKNFSNALSRFSSEYESFIFLATAASAFCASILLVSFCEGMSNLNELKYLSSIFVSLKPLSSPLFLSRTFSKFFLSRLRVSTALFILSCKAFFAISLSTPSILYSFVLVSFVIFAFSNLASFFKHNYRIFLPCFDFRCIR